MNPELKVNVVGDKLILLTGNALEDKYPEKIEISGNIDSIKNFLSKRYNGREGFDLQQVDKSKAIVLVDEENFVTVLKLDPQNPFGTVITGKLEFTTEFKQFFINEAKQFTREELIKLFKFNRRFIESDFEKLLTSYQKLSLATQGNVGVASDDRGNKSVSFNKVVDSQNIPTDFILNIPVFKGIPAFKFRVEICLDATDASVRFWFESVEAHDIIKKQSKAIIDGVLASCEDFVIIRS